MPESSSKQETACKQLAPTAICAEQMLLIDVRSQIEFETEHINGAINIPLDQLEARLEEIPRQKQIVVICRSGKRAERAAYLMMGKGMQPTVLEGGLLAWQKSGLPITEGKKMFPLERQIQLIVGTGVLCGVLLGAFVNPVYLIIPGFFGAGLTFAGLSGTCALGLLLMKAPWNRLPTAKTNQQKTKPGSGCCA